MSAIYESHAYPSYSQAGEDRVVNYYLECIGRRDEISYIDIGASSPAGHNNTYLFYSRGGSGVLVEADPMYLPAYQAIRPRDLVENVAIVPEEMRAMESVTFYKMENRGWSTVSSAHVSKGDALGKSGLVTPIEVPCLTINELLEKYCAGREVDLLSIDIEGVDAEIIKELNFDRFCPKVVIVENAGWLAQQAPGSSPIRGYTLFASTFVNSIFVSDDSMNRFRP